MVADVWRTSGLSGPAEGSIPTIDSLSRGEKIWVIYLLGAE
jgi:hypothetical protein